MRVLSDDQLVYLSQYRHKSEKTTLESMIADYGSIHLEKLHPDILSANSLTLIG